MKTLNDYLAMSYRMEIVEDKDGGGFVVSFPELPGCITCGDTIESAVANAENNHDLNVENLYVAETFVGAGPTLKRFRPMDHGKAFRINKRTSHITVVVKERA